MIRYISGLVALILVVCLAGFAGPNERTYGDWTVYTMNGVAAAQTPDLVSPRRGRALIFSCMGDDPVMLVSQVNYFAGDSDGDALYGIWFDDDTDPSHRLWGMLAPHRTMGMIMLHGRTNLRRQIQSRERVTIVAMDPYDQETVTMRFSLRGSRQAMQQLRCF